MDQGLLVSCTVKPSKQVGGELGTVSIPVALRKVLSILRLLIVVERLWPKGMGVWGPRHDIWDIK